MCNFKRANDAKPQHLIDAIFGGRIMHNFRVLSVFGDRQIGPKRRTDLVPASTIQDEAFLQEFEPSPPKHLSLEHF